MMPRRIALAGLSLLGLTALLADARPARGQGEFVEMLWKVPESANAIALVRAREFLDAPISLREGWPEAAKAAWGPPVAVTPAVRHALFASQLDLAGGLGKRWELGLVALEGPAQPEAIARADGGTVDDADDTTLIWSPRGLFYVPFKPDLIGIAAPVDRQTALRWADSARDRTEPVVSEYLQGVARSIQGNEAQYVLGIDLAGLSSPQQLRPHVARAASVDLKLDDIDAIAESLASIRGVTFEMTVGADIYGRLRVDFGKSTAPLQRIAKPLLLEVMEDLGAEVDAIRHDWSILVEDRAITYRGPLSPAGARRVASLVELPTAGVDAITSASGDPPADAPASPGAASQRGTKSYFQAIQGLLDDLTEKAVDQRRVALWCERYADKIDRMPVLGVDPELLDFGHTVSMTLRELANVAKGGRLSIEMRRTTDAAESGYAGFSDYYGYGYGASVQDTSRAAMERIRRQEGVKATAAEGAIWTELENQMAVMRRRMSERYGVEF